MLILTVFIKVSVLVNIINERVIGKGRLKDMS